jgi:hypothetical protein
MVVRVEDAVVAVAAPSNAVVLTSRLARGQGHAQAAEARVGERARHGSGFAPPL